MKKQLSFTLILLTLISLCGCGTTSSDTSKNKSVTEENNKDYVDYQYSEGDDSSENEGDDMVPSEAITTEESQGIDTSVIDSVFIEMWEENAIDIADANITDDHKNQVYLLCQTADGKYKVYGVETEEYGCRGICIDDIIDGEDNTNFFYDEWVATDSLPSISIVDGNEYVCEFHFYQMIDGKAKEQIVTLDSCDTGTVTTQAPGYSGYLINGENTYLPTEKVE